MHESTVRRVTTNKFIETPRGIFELKYFFTSRSAAMAATRTRPRRYGSASRPDRWEAPAEILSDDRIVEILQIDGIDIARRTVAKYREAMRIPSSVQRRREKLLRI